MQHKFLDIRIVFVNQLSIPIQSWQVFLETFQCNAKIVMVIVAFYGNQRHMHSVFCLFIAIVSHIN